MRDRWWNVLTGIRQATADVSDMADQQARMNESLRQAREQVTVLKGWPARWAEALARARDAERERDRYLAALEEIERVLEEGSGVALPRLRAWNIARQALNGDAPRERQNDGD